MRILCREQEDNEVAQEVTQRDQFNTDEVKIISTLVREPHQNSLDAKASLVAEEPVRTRIKIFDGSESNRTYFLKLFEPLKEHLEASEIDLNGIDLGRPRILLIEDFGTIGLAGDFANPKDIGPFNNFWRKIGLSTKGGTAGGRWGLGKLVFSSASKIRTFFGLTVRLEDEKPRRRYLMGQAVLSSRELHDKRYAPHVFFAEEGPKKLQMPVWDQEAVSTFCDAFQISRIHEPGLSIAIPFILDEITAEKLIPEVLQNYFFPILTGKLIVEVEKETISAETFDAIAARYGWGNAQDNDELVDFIRGIYTARQSQPDVIMATGWSDNVEKAIGDAHLEKLRAKLSINKEMVHVRAPINLKKKNGLSHDTHFDLFLKRTSDHSKGRSLYVRSAITVPDEARYFVPRSTFGALVASEEHITSFLGDAENPAHTRWNGQADKLKNWQAAANRLKDIRYSLTSLQNALLQAVDVVEPEALKDLFSIKDTSEKKDSKRKPTVPPKPPVPPIEPRPKLFRLERRKGGFVLNSDGGLTQENLPLNLSVKAAYDVLRGDPFKRFSPFDFDFSKDPPSIECTGATWKAKSANEIQISVTEISFAVVVEGFDNKRDLMIRVTR